jgi:hypothetical protein
MNVQGVSTIELARVPSLGAALRYGGGRFWLDNTGFVTAEQVLERDERADLVWLDESKRAWFYDHFGPQHADAHASETHVADASRQPADRTLWWSIARWILVLPGAVAAGLIAALAAQLFFHVGSYIVTPLSVPGEDAAWFSFLDFLLSPGVAAFAFVSAAVWIAPAARKAVAVFASVTYIGINVLGLGYAVSQGDTSAIVPTLSLAVGAACAGFFGVAGVTTAAFSE